VSAALLTKPGPDTGPPPGPAGAPGAPDTRRRTRFGLLGRHVVVPAVALAVLLAALPLGQTAWPDAWTFDAKSPLDELSRWLILNRDSHPVFLYFLLHLSNTVNSAVDQVAAFLDALGWLGVTVAATLGAWAAAGGGIGARARAAAGTALAAFAVIGLLGMWPYAMLTLALMAVAVGVSALLGLLLGLAAGLSDRAERVLRPVFDTMQVLPAFAYLLPFVLIFGIGTAPALFATVIYATPPMARLTSLGLRNGDPTALEASRALGASPWQQLLTARLPLALPRVMLGLNQTIMMALSMVVIASIIGAGGLGDRVFNGLTTQNVGNALTAGICIVLLAMWLDRATAAAGARLENPLEGRGPRRSRGWYAGAAALLATLAAWGAARLLPEGKSWPDAWSVAIAGPVNDAVDWMVTHLGTGVPVVGGTLVWAENFTLWLLNPLRDGLQAVPWWALLTVAAVLAFQVGRWRSAVTAVGSLAVIGLLGLWDKSLNTLSQVLAALLVTLLLGVVIGILAARARWLERALRPLLDIMQTMPQFIYLIPVVAMFGVGRIAAILNHLHNHFHQDRHLTRRDIFKQNRSVSLAEWPQLAA
jgi:glycine betaine/proline transport system permease protein